MLACYYVLAYLGFAAPYAVDALNAAVGRTGTFAALAGGAAALTAWLGFQARRASAPLPAVNYPERTRLTPTRPRESSGTPGVTRPLI